MPQLSEIQDIENTRLILWDLMLEETVSNTINLPTHIHHPKRIIEYLSTQKMKEALEIFKPISHFENGKPFIHDGPHISISHGTKIAGFIRSDKPVGLDIQQISPQIGRIRNKFCHPDELNDAQQSEDELAYLTLLWSAKEAVFKIYGEGLVFAEQIRIGPLKNDRNIALAMIYKNSETHMHEIKWQWIKGHVIVWSF